MGKESGCSGRPATGWRAVLAVLSAVGLVACGGDAEPAAAPTTLPPRVAAMWAEDSTWVAAAPADDVYVPGPEMPEEVRIEALMRRGTPNPDAEPQTVPGPEGAAQTLYADPASPEPWADRAVVVGRVAGSDVDGGFGGGEGTTAATIQGTQGRVGRYGELWFASWPIPSCDVCDQEAFVIGHGLTEEGVLAIAETVRQNPAPHADPATLPKGLRAMGSAPGSQGWLSVGAWPQELVMRSGDTSATFQIWSGDPRLYAHLAFWSRNGRPVESWRQGWMDLVQVGDVTVTITSTYDSPPPSTADVEALRAAAAALVPGDAAAVDAALTDAVESLEPLPKDRHLCPRTRGEESVWTTLSGVVEDMRWGLTIEVADGIANYCEDLWFATSGGGPTGGGGGRLGPVPPGGVRFGGGGITGSGDEPLVRMVAGDVPDSSVRVVVAIGDASVDADLAEVGPEPGRLWFATAFFVDSALGAFDVVAYDAAGNPVATGSQE